MPLGAILKLFLWKSFYYTTATATHSTFYVYGVFVNVFPLSGLRGHGMHGFSSGKTFGPPPRKKRVLKIAVGNKVWNFNFTQCESQTGQSKNVSVGHFKLSGKLEYAAKQNGL